MFRQRLLTSLIFVPLILLTIGFANGWVLAAFALLVMLIGAYEWAKLIPIEGWMRYAYALMVGMVLLLLHPFTTVLMGVGMCVWLGVAVMVLTYPASTRFWGKPWMVASWGGLFLPLWVLSLKAILELSQGRALLLTLLFFIWAADVGAYLVGRQWGRNKLLFTVSPGKTVEGALGGMVMASLVLYFAQMGFGFTFGVGFAALALLLVPMSILGDLFISMLKRRVSLKDTGRILPGHGGILDRFDSLIAASPLYYLVLTTFFQAG